MAWRLHDDIYVYVNYAGKVADENFVSLEDRQDFEDTVEEFLLNHELADNDCAASKYFNHFNEDWFEEFREIARKYEILNHRGDAWVMKIEALEDLIRMRNHDDTGIVRFLTDLHSAIKKFKREKYYRYYSLIFVFED